LVSGTTFGRNRDLIRGIHKTGGPVYYVDEDNSCEEIVNHLLDQGLAIIAAGDEVVGEPIEAARIMQDRIAELVSQVLMEVAVEELVIEGGATAHAILTWAGLRTFFPEEELAPGVIRMRAGEGAPLYLTVKPGSYEWPATMRHRLENE
jgi:D-threonate/D-erythronate kinase